MGFQQFFNNALKPLGFKVSEITQERRKVTDSSSGSRSKKPKNIFSLYSAEFGDLDSDRIIFYVETARKGMFFFKYLLFDDMRRRDLHTGGLLQKRKLSILGKLRHAKLDDLILCDWKEGKDFLLDNFRQKSVMFPNFLSDILEAQFQGVAIFEKIFKMIGSKIYLEKIPLLPGHLYLYDDVIDEYKFLDPVNNDALLNRAAGSVATDDLDFDMLSTIDIPPVKLLEVHGYDGNNANGFMNGFTDSMIYANFVKSVSFKDWNIFLEIYGLPPRLGKYDDMVMDDKAFGKFQDAVENFGNNYWAVINKNHDIELKDFNKTGSSDVYKTFVDHVETKQSIRVLGQNLTTQVTTAGTRAASETHHSVEEDILDSDILLLENTVNELMMDLLKLNFTNIPEEPKFRIPVAKNIADLEVKSRVYVNLKALGYTPSLETLESEFGTQLEESQPETPAQFTDKLINELWHSKHIPQQPTL